MKFIYLPIERHTDLEGFAVAGNFATKLKRLFSFGRGLTITKADLVEAGIPVISYGQIHSKQNIGTKIEQHLLRYVPLSYIKDNDSSKVKKGDLKNGKLNCIDNKIFTSY